MNKYPLIITLLLTLLLFLLFPLSLVISDCSKTFSFDANKYTCDCSGLYASAKDYNDYREYY